MAKQGYAQGTTKTIVNLLARLSLWMQTESLEIDDICEQLLNRFVDFERSRPVVVSSLQTCMGTLRKFLIAADYVAVSQAEASVETEAQRAVAQWCAWMRSERGLQDKTIQAHCYYSTGLVDLLTTDDGMVQWLRLEVPLINAYITERGLSYGVVARAHIIDSVRCLLRWALSTGRIDHELSAGILKPPATKRTLPQGVTADQVTALLSVCDPTTVIGARDRAVVTLLVRLGLRAGEAARLTLDDIDWAVGSLKVSGKGREHILPIPVDVGQALVAWLLVRPVALDRALFVRTSAPRRMMSVSAISAIIAKLSNLAGIEQFYAHRLRHTAAIGVLAAGGSLTEARELLGHAYTSTTMTYAKVDLVSLSTLVVPFGQVPR